MSPSRPKLLGFARYALLALAVLALYGPVGTFDFCNLDDRKLILDNYGFIEDLGNAPKLFAEDISPLERSVNLYYRPMYILSFMVDAQVGGQDARIYHVTNVLLHLVACALVLRLLLALGYRAAESFFFVLLFAIHPALGQAVCWIPGRNDILAAIFTVASVLAYIRYVRTGGGWPVVGHLFFLVLALLTKELTLMVPLVCILYAALLAPSRSAAEAEAAERTGLQRLLPKLLLLEWAIVCAGFLLVRQKALGPPGPSLAEIPATFAANVVGGLQLFGKTALPLDLAALPTRADSTTAYGGLALLLLGAFAIMARGRRPRYIAWGAAWSAAFIVPALALPGLADSVRLMEHRLYLPLIGLLPVWLECNPFRGATDRRQRAAGIAIGVVVVAAFAALGGGRLSTFRDPQEFWTEAVRSAPGSSLAHRGLAATYLQGGQDRRAEAGYRQAVRLDPFDPATRVQLALLMMKTGKPARAEQEFKEAIRIAPRAEGPRYHLAALYDSQGRKAEAAEQREQLNEINPRYSELRRRAAATAGAPSPSDGRPRARRD